MADLKLTLACNDYDRTLALKDGSVKPKGIDLHVVNMEPHEVFWRMLLNDEFDVAEMSTSNFITVKTRPNPRYVAIPVFLSRIFRHGYIFINKQSGIKKPQDLKGKRVGIPEYSMTALVWMRGFLQHDYGVLPSDITWCQGGAEGRHRKDRIKIDLPADVRIESLPEEKSLSDMLVDGEIDAMMHALVPPCIWENNPNVGRLFPDYREVEKQYYRKTGIFHIMHSVAIKKDVYDANPWVAESLYDSFCEAKRLSQEAIPDSSGAFTYMLPWVIAEYESTIATMGQDYWPYGLTANRPTLEAMTLYAYEQGLASRKLDIEEIFAVNK